MITRICSLCDMSELVIKSLKDLDGLRSAPDLDATQSKHLLDQLCVSMGDADWFTVGIMAPSSSLAIFVLREMESRFNWSAMNVVDKPAGEGPVFLKANQKTGDIHVRIEHGLGEGVLLSCQHNNEEKEADTLGPFPLDFFKIKD
ncbi:conserved hypothetical protein [Prochlorococcus marinus str. MIT 9303]|uniref:DUF1824 domain-containing protein n=2 Tax=Prochlorococcus marinus TaxID=1219 RepID=A2CBN1_PROM3|nr:conserved hypothetical protein [Prochlorococcus marinus str. MIT 9303]